MKSIFHFFNEILNFCFESKGDSVQDELDTVNGSFWAPTEVYSESVQTYKMELFAEMINSFQLLTAFAKSSLLNVWMGFNEL